jgi:hypothetical protein
MKDTKMTSEKNDQEQASDNDTSHIGDPTSSQDSKVKPEKQEPIGDCAILDIITDMRKAIDESLRPDADFESVFSLNTHITSFLECRVYNKSLEDHYNILFIYDKGGICDSVADRIYRACKSFTDNRPIMLMLYSIGGEIAPAYLIGKICREYAKEKFVTVVPRQAKSAATLICCAADEIHMGSLSELGPIDPLLGNSTAFGIKKVVESLAEIIEQYPHTSDMLAKYSYMSLEPIHIGDCESTAESAVQYAERLLNLHPVQYSFMKGEIANKLVYSYKDRGFVIDKSEAAEIFGDKAICVDTEEYKFGEDFYTAFKIIDEYAELNGYDLSFVGSFNSNAQFVKKREGIKIW